MNWISASKPSLMSQVTAYLGFSRQWQRTVMQDYPPSYRDTEKLHPFTKVAFPHQDVPRQLNNSDTSAATSHLQLYSLGWNIDMLHAYLEFMCSETITGRIKFPGFPLSLKKRPSDLAFTIILPRLQHGWKQAGILNTVISGYLPGISPPRTG